jgi:peptidoglycan hydrolase-like protein with peptidoglycan-binding domain
MNMRTVLILGAALLIPCGAVAANGPYTDFVKLVQEALYRQGFYAGPVNGDFGSNTQAALAQFQLSRALPASGQLDDPTLAELGVEREVQASAGASGETSTGLASPLPVDSSSAPAQPSPSSEPPAEPKPPATEHKPEG